MKPTKLICVILFCFVSSVSYSQVKSTKEQTVAACEKFMKHFLEGKYTEPMQVLKQYSVLDVETIDGLEVTVKKQLDAISSYGKMLSYEFIQEKKIKELIAKRFYLMKFEKYFLKFAFALYNNSGRSPILSLMKK